jgi:cytidyltransferase-like protein
MSIVYVGMAADILHKGHINLLNEASKYGRVVVGLLTDDAIESYKRKPIINYENRYIVISNLKMVDKVIKQESKYWSDNIRQIKPDFVVHGDDWIKSNMNSIRNDVISILSEIGGELIEIPYTSGISTTDIIEKIQHHKYNNIKINDLKKIGSLIQNTISNIKRTPEHISNDLGININTLKKAINGELNINEVDNIINMIYYKYPIPYKDIHIDIDDTNDGIIYYSKVKSLESRRITKRKNEDNVDTNYYEYRDTAVSRHSPFKPEWIKMLRIVNDQSPDNRNIVMNKGHLLTQCTFFIGDVNFYYEINNEIICSRMKTGDSNFITPYVPHSFTKNNNDNESIIIAVTFSNLVQTNMNDLLFTDINQINNISGDVRNKNKLFLKKLYREMELKNISKKEMYERLLSSNISESNIDMLFENGETSNIIYDKIIDILNIFPHKLMTYDFTNSDEVNIKRNKDKWNEYSNNLYYKGLACSKFFSGFSGSNNKIIGKTEILKSSYHQYIYVYKNDLEITWTNKTQIVEKDGSIYIKPFVDYRLSIVNGECLFICMKLCGELNSEYLDEFSTFNVNGRNRIANETSKWW